MTTDLLSLLDGLTDEQIVDAVSAMTPDDAQAVLDALGSKPLAPILNPLAQAQSLDPVYRSRPHLEYLSTRLAKAVEDVKAGVSRYLVVSMPPRAGKSQLSSVYLPAWLLSQCPSWPIGLISHDPGLAVQWGRDVRALVEERSEELGVDLAKDAGAAAEWKTTEKGGVLSRSTGQSITGRGFKVLIVDDAVKDFADAHSPTKRDALWNWWRANAMTRQNGPWLVVFIGTRWHEDDILGRLTSDEYDGDPTQWEVIKFPAIAEDADVLGRKPGEPLLSPIIEETPAQAVKRWAEVERAVGSYAWSALYQQSPSPSKGAIFDSDWWRFWTVNPAHVSRDADGNPDGKVIPLPELAGARWLDSWDMAFKATNASDYVVGQRWAQLAAQRFLMHQFRGRLTFTETLKVVRTWVRPTDPQGRPADAAPYSDRVHERLVEDKANGTAVIDTLKASISGLIPVNPTESKEARARSITPDVESGSVVLPYPGDPGNEWVMDLLKEAREFPTGKHDDQVDALTQAQSRMRTPRVGRVSSPVGMAGTIDIRSRTKAALNQRNRR